MGKLGSSSSERSVEKRPRKKPGHPNRDRAGPKQNLAKAVAAPMVPKLLPPPPPQPAVRTERLRSFDSEKVHQDNNGASPADLEKQKKENKKRQQEKLKDEKRPQKEQKKKKKKKKKKKS